MVDPNSAAWRSRALPMVSRFFILFMIFVTSFAISSCGIGGYEFINATLFVRVTNNCAPLINLEWASGTVYKGLAYGESATIPMESSAFGNPRQRLALTVKGFTSENPPKYLGSITREFTMDSRQGHKSETWEIDRLRLPGGRGGCFQ